MVIYNPSSGKESAANKVFQAGRYVMEDEEVEITYYATKKKDDAVFAAKRACNEGYDMIISCGGDGTVHEVVNGIMKSNKKTRLGILPAGTVNDFAAQLNIPWTSEEFADMIVNYKFKNVDIGKINDDYFVNVVSGGAFINIPHSVTVDAKTLFGKYAYYFQAAIEIPGQLEKSYNIKYTIDGNTFNIDTFLFLISNTTGAGGFKQLCPHAKYDDGMLDIVIFEKASHADLIQIFTGVFNGQHVKHPKVHYFQAKDIKIDTDDDIVIDIDGEQGEGMPLEIHSLDKGLEILTP